ncbi:DUF1289 domain-containing protein [Cupriavidus yeoncheonensis]
MPIPPPQVNEAMNPSISVANPCINICRMDQAGKYCQGCGRTLVEIGRWEQMTDEQRAEVTALLPARRPNRGTQAPRA